MKKDCVHVHDNTELNMRTCCTWVRAEAAEEGPDQESQYLLNVSKMRNVPRVLTKVTLSKMNKITSGAAAA